MNKTLEDILEIIDNLLSYQEEVTKLEIAQHISNSIEDMGYDDYELRVKQSLLLDYKEELTKEIKELLNAEGEGE
jgi:dissimilatory sulfite reductase (desulfoviridin) alpha/beta subunit